MEAKKRAHAKAKLEREPVGGALWVVRLSWRPTEPKYGRPKVEFQEQARLVVFDASDFKDAPPFVPGRSLVSRALFAAGVGLQSVSAFDPFGGPGSGEGRWISQWVSGRGEREPDDEMWARAIESLKKACGAKAAMELPEDFLGLRDLSQKMARYRGESLPLEWISGVRAVLEAVELSDSVKASSPASAAFGPPRL